VTAQGGTTAGLVREGILFSDVLRFAVHDGAGRRAKVQDLAVDPAGGEFPAVRFVLGRRERQEVACSWAELRPYWRYRRFEVDSLEASPPVNLEHLVLLRRDVLDGLLVDVPSLTVTRANDLWLHQLDEQLYLGAADTSPWAVVRRLARGCLGHGRGEHLLDWKNVEYLRGEPTTARAAGDYHAGLADLNAGSLARLAEALPYFEGTELLLMVSADAAAHALEVMAPAVRLQIFEELPPDRAVEVLSRMTPDAATDLLGLVESSQALHFLELLPHAAAEKVVELLRYSPDTAGGIMTNDLIAMATTASAGEVLELLKDRLQGTAYFQTIFATDGAGRLRGQFTLRQLLLANQDQAVATIMSAAQLTAAPLEPARDAAHRLIDNQLGALPVVAHDGRLIGTVTLDAAVALVAPAAWRDRAPRIFA